jgi:hypothetical protein
MPLGYDRVASARSLTIVEADERSSDCECFALALI